MRKYKMRLRKLFQPLGLIIFVFIYSFNSHAEMSRPKYVCPNAYDIKVDEDGYAYARGGWIGIALIPEEWKNTWQNYLSSIVYTQPLRYSSGLKFSCQYFTDPLIDSFGTIQLKKISATDNYHLYRVGSNTRMGNCGDTHFNSEPNEKNCFWGFD